jgi:lysophospholipase L1-like esterase
VNGQLQNDLAPWAEAVRRVAAETGVPLIDLNAKSAVAVQALGPALSAQFAQVAPSADVAAALFTGTTMSAHAPPSAPPPAPLARAGENAAAEPLGQARLSFDYTHLGDEGAAFFAAMVTHELIVAVPALRGKLVP